jgi:serine acetyltransferase
MLSLNLEIPLGGSKRLFCADESLAPHVVFRFTVRPRCIILPKGTVGEGAVVAAGAVVTKYVEPYAVVGGVPSRKIAEPPTNMCYNPSAESILFI